jgi:pimeloyl-ACP methyl ester carboxylesterase
MHVQSTLGVQIAVHDLGGQGERLLVSHATGFHGRCYEPLATALTDRFHSVAFDYRGHGDTPRPEGPVDWERYGDDAEAMARWLAVANGGPIAAFGHSMGGACLLMAAARAPELFRHLVVFEPIVFPPVPAEASGTPKEGSSLANGARRRRATFLTHEAAIENFAAKPPLGRFTPAALEAYVRHGFAPDPAQGAGVHLKCRPDTEAETFEMGPVHHTWDALPSIQVPVTVVSGAVAPMQPSMIAAQVAERLPNARYLQFDHLDHFGPMVEPATVAAIVADAVA